LTVSRSRFVSAAVALLQLIEERETSGDPARGSVIKLLGVINVNQADWLVVPPKETPGQFSRLARFAFIRFRLVDRILHLIRVQRKYRETR
jgi:hypothetical protein